MDRLSTPCYQCPRHCPGCHNPETCKAWAEYQRQKDIFTAQRRAVVYTDSMMSEYKKQSRYSKDWRANFAK